MGKAKGVRHGKSRDGVTAAALQADAAKAARGAARASSKPAKGKPLAASVGEQAVAKAGKGKRGSKRRGDFSEAIKASAEVDAAKAREPEVIKRYKENLPCPITDDKLIRSKADELAGVILERLDLLEERAAAMRGFKSRREHLDEQERELAVLVKQHTMMKPVQVEERLIMATGEIIIVRLDTGAEVGRKPATRDDLQRTFEKDERAATGGSKPAKPPKRGTLLDDVQGEQAAQARRVIDAIGGTGETGELPGLQDEIAKAVHDASKAAPKTDGEDEGAGDGGGAGDDDLDEIANALADLEPGTADTMPPTAGAATPSDPPPPFN